MSDRGVPDQQFAHDLDFLKRLHHVYRIAPGEEGSRDPTVILPDPLELCPASPSGPAVPSPSAAKKAPVTVPGPPRRIGKYVVVEELEAGGQAFVFRVLHPELGRDFVLKLGRRPLAAGQRPEAQAAAQSGLLREGRLLAQCEHPNLVRAIDLDFHEGQPFVVMEHVPGLNLEQFVDQHRPDPRQAARLVTELARAVAYLHARGITHQDIKPRNVMVDDQGRPRLIDFGLARLKHAWSDERDEPSGGTAAYMSPEQALGCSEGIGPWTDIFGLGGLLYYLLTRRPLYHGASRISVTLQAIKGEYLPVRQLNPGTPRMLERICRKALAAEPRHRFHSAPELERALNRSLARHWRSLAGAAFLALATITLMLSARRNRATIAGAGTEPGGGPGAAQDHCARRRYISTPSRSRKSGGSVWSHGWPTKATGCASRPGSIPRVMATCSALNPDGKVQLCLPQQAGGHTSPRPGNRGSRIPPTFP